MKIEIGSEFWDVPVTNEYNELFPQNSQWYLSGRVALKGIIKELERCMTVAMPSWCCDSMIKPFLEAGFDVIFYPTYFNGELIQEISMDSDVLFLMDYFGYKSKVNRLSDYKGVVIRDVTHSIFSSISNDADYYFGSLRKWCGVWTGGYAWKKDGIMSNIGDTDNDLYISYRKMAMLDKAEYINGNRTDKNYLYFFEQAEEYLNNSCISHAAERDVKIAKHLDIEFIKNQRRSNAKILIDAFLDWCIFKEMQDSDCPMFVPIIVPNNRRDALRKYLIMHKVYCPIHWPLSVFHKTDKRTEYLYKNELSLVCDQRYTVNDMIRMVDVINEFMEK